MSKRSRTLRALVTERLTAAAEEIFELVERTIAEYEEELCRSKEENQRRQQLLDSLQTPPRIKDVPPAREESVPDREDPLSSRRDPERFPFTADSSVKAEDAGDHPELGEETPGEREPDLKPFKSETVEQIDISSDSDGGWESAAGCSSQRMETEAEEEEERYDRDVQGNSPEIPLNDFSNDFSDGKVQTHECLACGETFGASAALQQHMASHVGGKPFSCPVCGKDFTRRNDFQLHLTVHTGDAPFKCPECEARFALKSHLDSHMKGHRAAPLCCPVCKKSFTRKYRLHSHMASHTGERPFSCPVCGRGFTRKDNLGTHMAMHNGKPFICAVCNRCFVRKDRLSAHMASHAGETFCK